MNVASVKTAATSLYKPGPVSKAFSRVGNMVSDKVDHFFDFETTTSISREAQFAILALCVLVSRYVQARNKDERREILTRDVGMVITAVYGVPIFKKIVSNLINEKTGLPIAFRPTDLKKENDKKTQAGLKMASYDQLREWYSVKKLKDFERIKGKFSGFLRNIEKLGGNVIKTMTLANKNVFDENLSVIAKRLNFKDRITNHNIVKFIRIAEQSEDSVVKTHMDIIKEGYIHDRDKGIISPIVKKASHMKSGVGLTCIGLSALLLGGILPWFNIQYTKNVYKDKDENEKNPQPQPVTQAPVAYAVSSQNSEPSTNRFKEFHFQ